MQTKELDGLLKKLEGERKTITKRIYEVRAARKAIQKAERYASSVMTPRGKVVSAPKKRGPAKKR